METGKHWSDVVVWKEAHQLVLRIYSLLALFPKDEKYNLTSQIKRAAVSVPTNIVEGHSKNSTKDFSRYLYIARGSLEEMRYLFMLSTDLKYITRETCEDLVGHFARISTLLNHLIKSLH